LPRLAAFLVVLAAGLAACGGGLGPAPPPDLSGITSTNLPKSPFGVSMSERVPLEVRVKTAQLLHAYYYRATGAILDGTDQFRFSSQEPPEAFEKAGFKLALNARNYPGTPGVEVPPSNYDAYKAAIGAMIDQYHPAVLVIGNEPDDRGHSNIPPTEYQKMLTAGCEVARSKQTPCADGAFLSNTLVAAVYMSYVDSGDQAKADDFASRAFGPNMDTSPANLQRLATNMTDYIQVLRGIKPTYVNIHSYVDDAGAFAEMVDYMAKQTGIPVITNEMGQTVDDPHVTICLMRQVVALKMDMAIWFSTDGSRARALNNPDGSLRPTGEAFKQVITDLAAGKHLPSC